VFNFSVQKRNGKCKGNRISVPLVISGVVCPGEGWSFIVGVAHGNVLTVDDVHPFLS